MQTSLRISVLFAMLLLSSCAEFGANAVDGSDLHLTEGSILLYDDLGDFRFTPFPSVSDQVQMRLLSLMATIGGRDSVIAFQSTVDRSIQFLDRKDGRLWHFFQTNRDFERSVNDNGVWIRIPIDGDPEVSAEISDRIYTGEGDFSNPVTRILRVTPAGSVRFYVGGYHFSARKVVVESEFSQANFGDRQTEEITYLDELGAIGERSVSTQFGVQNHFLLNKIQIKER
jgi:hypothetical protein